MDGAPKHCIISAGFGVKESVATRDDYAKVVNACKSVISETESNQRERGILEEC